MKKIKEIKHRKYDKIPHNLSREIFERTLPKKEMSQLIERYNKAKKTTTGMSRATNLNRPITEFEKVALDHYLNSTDEPMREFAENAGKPVSQCLSAVHRAAKKIVYQNLEKVAHVLK